MANTLSPHGFAPRKMATGSMYNASVTAYKIASAYATNIFVGDAVKLVSGYIQKAGASDQIRGIAQGFDGILASGLPFSLRYWVASTALKGGQDGIVYVIDDPSVEFSAQFGNSTNVPATADIGKYFKFYDAGGNTASGISGEGIDYSTATTTSTSGTWKFISFAPTLNNDLTSAYSRGLFKPTLHDGLVASGSV